MIIGQLRIWAHQAKNAPLNSRRLLVLVIGFVLSFVCVCLCVCVSVCVCACVCLFVCVFLYLWEQPQTTIWEQTPLSEYTGGSGRCRNRELESFSNDISITVKVLSQSQLYSHSSIPVKAIQSQLYAFTLHLFSHSILRMDWVILLMTGAAPRLRVLYLSNAITIDTGRNRQTRTHRQKYCQMIEEILEDNW